MTDVLSALQQMVPGGFDRDAIANRIGAVDVDTSDPSRVRLTYTNRNDLTIPIGTWTLRLLPRLDPTTGGERVVMDLLLDAAGDVTEVRIDVARFELEADPRHLTAGHLRTEPFTHIVPMSGPSMPPVRLLGPGLTVGLRGPDLSEPFVDLTGATGGIEPALPSMRFDPPHFIVGRGVGVGDLVGIACDEALLDLNPVVSPPGPLGTTLPPTWTGLYLKDLGVFLNNDPANDTWSFMARMQDFFVGFEGFDLSGTLSAELAHHVVDAPQLSLEGVWQTDSGAIEELPTTPLPAPTGDRTHRRVRLAVRPSWDSAGFAVDWDLPPGVEAEEPLRLDQPDVGWLRVEPGTHSVTVRVTDHRVPDQSATQVLSVGAPTGAGANLLRVEAVARVIGGGGAGNDGEPHRIHVHIPRSAQLRLTARMVGGEASATSAEVTLFVDDLQIATSSPTTSATVTITRSSAGTYPEVEWHLMAPAAAPAAGAIGVGVELSPGPSGPSTVGTDRLRYELYERADANAPDLAVDALADWLAEPGGALARLALFGGVTDEQVSWTLDSRAMPLADLHGTASDAVFVDGTTWPGTPESVSLPLSGNVARTEVAVIDRLWRLTATVGGATAADRLILVGEDRTSHRMAQDPIRSAWGAAGAQQVQGRTAAFRFAYYSAGLQAEDHGPGPEGVETPAQAWAKQVLGARALLEEIATAGTQLREIHLAGAASAEGPDDLNIRLGMRRAESARDFLVAVRDGSPPAWLGPVPAGSAAAIAGAGPITVGTVGERGANSGVSQGTAGAGGQVPASGERIDVEDRRVVAILRVAGRPIPSVSRRTYFYTGAGARPLAPPPLIARRVPRHPFEHAIFRQAHLEVELLRSELIRAQVRLTLDLKRFNDSDDLAPAGDALPPLNPQDGVTTFFLEYRKILDPAGSRWSWDAAVLSDPGDLNGLAVTLGDPARAVGPPLITIPAMAAIAGGQLGSGTALGAVALGAALSSLGVIRASKVTWVGFRGRLAYGTTPPVALRIGVDYTVEYAVDVDLGPLGRLRTTPGRPLKVTFRNLGVTWTSPDRFDVDYDPMSGFALRVDDPGVFQLGEGIGRLLNVRSAATGAGSPLWVEVELRFAIETGVFAIDTLKVRLSVDSERLFERDPVSGRLRLVSDDWLTAVSVTISKIGMSANLPGVLSGRGQLEISGSGGSSTVAGDLDVNLVPLNLTLGASFGLFTKPPDRRAVYLGLAANFRPGFPLGNTGVALYGLLGLTGVNIGRSIPEQDRVLEWYKTPTPGVRPVDKWTMRDGAWVFGVGATLGTAPDGGILWNTAGALLVQTPGPQILLAADSQFLTPTSDPESPLSAGLQTVILLDFENGAFLAAAELSLVRRPLIELVVPAEIFFNLRRSVDWHIHLGKWQPESKRVRASLLGGIFDAWAYIQVEGDGFSGPVTLEGLCIAHGMRTTVLWGSRSARIYFEAWIEYHLGLQLSPLYLEGLLTAGGELHLGPISLGADVAVQAKVGVDPDILSLHGEACGSVKIWFVRIRGCVGIDIGDGSRTTPAPPSPLAEFAVIDVLTDEVTDRNEAPLDCALHLVFDQPVFDARGPDAAIDLGTPRRVQVSPELFYEYDLTALSISPAASVTPAAWAQPSLPDPDPSNADGARTLRVRAWEPTAFPKALTFSDGYDSQLAGLLERMCEEPPGVREGCATFDDQPLGAGSRWRLRRPTLRTVDVVAASGEVLGAGAIVPATPGGVLGAAVVPLPGVAFDGLAARDRALRLPARPAGLQDRFDTGAFDAISTRDGPLHDLVVTVRPGAEVEVSSGLLDVIPGLDDPVGPMRALGSVAIRLPDLVAAEAVLMLPAKHRGGAFRYYDAALRPLGPSVALDAGDLVSGATLGAQVANHEVRALQFDGFAPAAEDGPARAGWLVIWATEPLRLSASWDPATYLLQVCGTTYGEWRAGERLAETRTRTTTWLTDTLVTPASAAMATGVPMLAPNTSYTLTGTIAWRRYRDATTATTDGDGTHAINETFRTASAPPVDIRRYISYVDPAGPAQPQYRAEPVFVRFASDAIDALFGAFGQQIVTRLKADVGGDSANMAVTEGRFTIATAVDSFEEAFAEALGRSCIAGDAFLLFPKTEIRTPHELAPNTGYTLSLVPRSLGEPGGLDPEVWDRQLELAVEGGVTGSVVHRTDLLASRWRTFGEHVAAYAAAAVGAGHVLADDATAAEAALTALPPMTRGDLAMDDLLAVLVGGPVRLPEQPEVHWIWGLDVPASDGLSLPSYRLLGILLDGPEPLLRMRPDGSDSVDVAVSTATTAGPSVTAAARVLAGTTGSRLVITAPLAGVAQVAIGLTYRRVASDAPDSQTLTLSVPAAPGVGAG